MSFLNCPYNEEHISENVNYNGGLSGDRFSLEIEGLTPERSYEDRDVFINIPEESIGSRWIRGENAIELGTKLIQHGNRALTFNRQQLFHYMRINRLTKYIDENRVSEITLVCLSRKCLNYGEGFFLFRITPKWKENRIPEYDEDFSLEAVIHFSPFEKEFKEELAFFKRPVYFEAYSHEEEVVKFNDRVMRMSGKQTDKAKGDLLEL